MTSYIVDASFILHSLLGQVNDAARFLENIFADEEAQVLAPSMLKIEIANALRFSLEDPNLRDDVLTKTLRLPITYLDPQDFHLSLALRLAHQTKTTVYDSLYHCLALNLQAIFVTSDKKYYLQAHELGNIQLIG